MMQSETISFSITNTTNGIVPISLFGNYGDPMDNANASTQYSWNVSGFSITNENLILLQYKGVNQTLFTIVTIPFGGTTLQDVVDVLNAQNLGSFFITTSGGNTFINNYNDNVVFGNLQILNPSVTSLTYAWNFSGLGGKAEIFVNFLVVISDPSPTTASGSVAIAVGDTIGFAQTSSNKVGGTNFSIFNITTQSYLVQNTLNPLTFLNNNFVISANNSYFLTAEN